MHEQRLHRRQLCLQRSSLRRSPANVEIVRWCSRHESRLTNRLNRGMENILTNCHSTRRSRPMNLTPRWNSLITIFRYLYTIIYPCFIMFACPRNPYPTHSCCAPQVLRFGCSCSSQHDNQHSSSAGACPALSSRGHAKPGCTKANSKSHCGGLLA